MMTTFTHHKSLVKFSNAQEHITPLKIKFKRDFMPVLVTCKNEADLKNIEAERV